MRTGISTEASRGQGLTLFALAPGSFAIGTSEFASMGILQLFSDALQVDVPKAPMRSLPMRWA